MEILIINGPNLANIGSREVGIYGSESFDSFLSEVRGKNPNIVISYYQSHVEGEIINAIYSAVERGVKGIVLNAGAYTHTSVAIADCIAAINAPVVEVHISNVTAREPFRHTSLLAPKCIGMVLGFGLMSYELAISALSRECTKK